MTAPTRARPPEALTSHVPQLRPPPASVTYPVTLPFPAHAGPRVPPDFDQSRIALPKRSRDPDPNRVHPNNRYKYVPQAWLLLEL